MTDASLTPADIARRGIRVKPLVWDGPHYASECGKYVAFVSGQWWCRADDSELRHADNLESARAAAEADHAARVCAMLEIMEDGK